MHSRESLREMRAQEHFLFGGVPAQPEPMYAAGSYRLFAEIRHTRRSGGPDPSAPTGNPPNGCPSCGVNGCDPKCDAWHVAQQG